jgi:hypothetical protein
MDRVHCWSPGHSPFRPRRNGNHCSRNWERPGSTGCTPPLIPNPHRRWWTRRLRVMPGNVSTSLSRSAAAACWMRPRRLPDCCASVTRSWITWKASVPRSRTGDRPCRSSRSRQPPAPAARPPETPSSASLAKTASRSLSVTNSWCRPGPWSTRTCWPPARASRSPPTAWMR